MQTTRPLMLALASVLCLQCAEPAPDAPEPEQGLSSQSYKGHESDADSNHFVTAHPEALGTRLEIASSVTRAARCRAAAAPRR